MGENEKSLNISEVDGVKVVAFCQSSVLDIATSQAMAKQLLRLAKSPPPPRVLLDFTDVKFLASRMLGILVEMIRMAETGRGRVVVCGLRPELTEMLHLMRLDRIIQLARDRSAGHRLLAAGAEA